MAKVCVVGLGYIGLPTAIIAAQHGHAVIGFDVDADRVTRINAKDPVIKEPAVADRLHEVIEAGMFLASTEIVPADYYIIAVPTPFKEAKKADLSYVWQAVDAVARVMPENAAIILESTIPVGTTDAVADWIAKQKEMRLGVDFFVAHCPERVLPGNILHELINNSRIIGGVDEKSLEQAQKFYASFVKGELFLTSAVAAEMVKLVENSSRDVAIAFANQVAAMAEEVGLDPFEVIELANKHPRVSILNPSCGVGGHCIAVDPWFLIESFPEQTKLLHAARTINDQKPLQILEKIASAIAVWRCTHRKDPVVAVLGVSYKPNVDDMRESPALFIAQAIAAFPNVHLKVVDPCVPKSSLERMFQKCVSTLEDALAQADIVIGLVKHADFALLGTRLAPEQEMLDYCGLLYQKRTAGMSARFCPARAEKNDDGGLVQARAAFLDQTGEQVS